MTLPQQKITRTGIKQSISMSKLIFHPVEVVGCGSQTQLQVGEKKVFFNFAV